MTGLDCCDKKLAGYVRPALPLLPLLGGLVGLLACTSGYLVSAKSGWSLVKHISHLLTINKTLPGLSSMCISMGCTEKKSKYWERTRSMSNLVSCTILPNEMLCLIVYVDLHDIFTEQETNLAHRSVN